MKNVQIYRDVDNPIAALIWSEVDDLADAAYKSFLVKGTRLRRWNGEWRRFVLPVPFSNEHSDYCEMSAREEL